MTTRILLAGILAGLGMFIWTSIAHMVLPLGEAGVGEIPHETTVSNALRTNIGKEGGLYVFPGFGLGEHPSREAKSAAMKGMADKVARNPSGLLVYHPPGSRTLNLGKLLGTEFAVELLCSILAVFLLSLTRLTSFGSRIGFITIIGVIAACATNLSYWNWYGFPGTYTAAYICTQGVGFIVAGLVAALVLRRTSFAPAAPVSSRTLSE